MKKLLICLLIFVGAIFISCNFVINATTTKTVPEQPMIQTEPLSLIVETPAPSTDILLEEEPAPTPEPEPLATREEIELLALCTMAEAEGECEQGQRLVIDSVLNRVDNPHFPNTISEVIWQKNQYAGMYGDRITRCYVMDELVKLVEEELENRTDYDVVFFNADHYSDYGVPMFQVGNHYFSSYTYHYEDKDWDLFRCKEVATAPEWDGHTDKDVERVLSLSDDESDWAAREVALASQKEREGAEDKDDWDYGVACYESALRAYRSLERDGHSGMSIQITKSILNRLIDGKCLTPIEDDPDIWTKVEFGEDDPIQHFQCKRMSSLFKDVAEDGTVTYSDVNRVQLINKESPDIPFRNGFGTRLIDKMYPITLPYFPADKKFKIIVEEFLTDEKNGDFDTVGYLQLILPDGKVVELNGYFKDGPDGMVRIEQAEYEERKANRIDKK